MRTGPKAYNASGSGSVGYIDRDYDILSEDTAAPAIYVVHDSDVVLGLGPWSLVVLKDKFVVLGPGLGLAP